MEKKKISILFLNPFRYSAVPLGNINIAKSISKDFRVYAFRINSFKLNLDRPVKAFRVSDNPFVRAFQIIFRIPESSKIDVLIGNGNILELPFVYLAKMFNRNIKYVFFLHTCYERFSLLKKGSLMRKLTDFSYRNLMKKADSVVAISSFASGGFIKNKILDRKKTFVVINSVDTEFFTPEKRDVEWLKKRYGIRNSRKNILYLGKLSKSKRAYLIPKLAKLLPEFNFIVQGNNEIGIDFSKNSNVYFSDARPPREEIPKIFASSDLFMFPSEVEPCAAVVTEAMASGLPVVASKAGSVPEQVIEGKNSLTVQIKKGELNIFSYSARKILKSKIMWNSFSEESRKRALELDRKIQGKKYDSAIRFALKTEKQ